MYLPYKNLCLILAMADCRLQPYILNLHYFNTILKTEESSANFPEIYLL